ncbi:Ni(2(+)) ABC transporter ATP binding subunit NikE [Rhodovastum atsumiense]|uniref:ABC transporter ATP-binding protein n=1 Tax=Rhodovastum atsumiense TaxID=504468 RepID=A0A5M6J1D2_9PROT|nr:dipeptide/oligopeptide/nickel ABC transporter ATP-binding protein [Rhodovastum atsumiense]KAA5614403.1 ABC transporter ATP-binding protein [Rhodovastum atsumiense]CAH2604882.1 Ni(2(+)) ABC transporter ATP binding subunit NikE [Rhodovastum atsumiense]
MSLLELRQVDKSYRQGGLFGPREAVRVLDRASLDVGRGECVALLGPSGAGKSTLARIALGLEWPDSGEVRFDGMPLLDDRGRMAAATRRAIQAVFQDPYGATSPRFSAFEVIAEPLRYAGLSGAPLRARVRELAEQVELDPGALSRLAHRFSGGQLQRLCIARALALQPRLLVLDEAVSSLDLTTQARVLALLTGLRRRHGVGFLFITHDLRLLRGFADRVLVMEDGRPVEVDDPFAPEPAIPALARLQAAMLPARPGLRPGPSRGHKAPAPQ